MERDSQKKKKKEKKKKNKNIKKKKRERGLVSSVMRSGGGVGQKKEEKRRKKKKQRGVSRCKKTDGLRCLGQHYGVRDKSDVEAQLGSTLWSSGQIRCSGGSAWINIMEFGTNQMWRLSLGQNCGVRTNQMQRRLGLDQNYGSSG